MEYRRSLDGLRGVAVAEVVAYHVDIYHVRKIFPGGWGGRYIFRPQRFFDIEHSAQGNIGIGSH